MSAASFTAWAEPLYGGDSTHVELREIPLPGAGTFALITIVNSNDRKPATFSPGSLLELGTLLEGVRKRAAAGELVGVGVTGQHRCFVAGADLTAMKELKDPESARRMARLGHDVFGILNDMDVPTFAFINGAAIGGGLEIALAADYRTISSGANGISLPEAFLGLVPGWGGVYRLPRLIGPGNAVKVMIENALSNNRVLDGTSAFELGIADTIFEPTDFLEQSLAWAIGVIHADAANRHQLGQRRAAKAAYTAADWDTAVARGRTVVETKTANAAPAPTRVLDLLERGQHLSPNESADLETDALTELIQTPQFKNSVYAFLDLLQRRSKNPVGAPDPKLGRPVTKVGVVGAGLMAGQLALLFARQLQVPVVMTDIDQARADKGVGYVHAEVDKLLIRKRISIDAANRTKALVTGSVSKEAFADADFVIEAVFEELSIKKQVFAEVEAVVRPECIIATNTSSLSVTEMAAGLRHPERVVGFHFFNPVAAMPLLEIVQAPRTSDEVLATAFGLGKALGKTTVLVQDSTAFVVNRVLLRLMGEVAAAFDEGTPAEVADHALKCMGLPMTPFTLLAMIGLPVSLHVTRSLNAAFGDRFPVSANQQKLIDHGITSLWELDPDGSRSVPDRTLEILEFGDSPSTSEGLLVRVQDALAEEIALMLDEGVVVDPDDVDLCMLAGAGWPLHLGGITPYLDRTGASERVNGRWFRPASHEALTSKPTGPNKIPSN
ncbi:3-hydroxyacyl-CoA dehydrogenase NAD-binding domain-containing protein [Arthrobacter sp. STN4]|uniref:3-hydroxyacyl-CoA dehydrogenase NAD-binding domain-containing protein n=1 Tax=Arthrobacter sp. STN4 TaxID=2923276 RepID=UPI00211A58EA|nr:3-hydroxyacyl-CoA dehydrogenase NAD-binding domain-containing protein [Arthrobacter sp. STN4]MCQ9165478.1 3-hydroxyacyl-CoA dehydrogenase NAD-binding domain-containing protein [Arthrobacter sp. STN4]